MPDSQDYRSLLDEKFKHLNDNMELKFDDVHTKLQAIIVQTTKTNGNVIKAQSEIEELKLKEATHIITCPQGTRIKGIEDDLSKYKASQADLNFIQKHPMLGVSGIGVAVVICIFVFFGWNKVSTSKGETQNKELLEQRFKELQVRDEAIQMELDKQNVHYETLLNEIKNKK